MIKKDMVYSKRRVKLLLGAALSFVLLCFVNLYAASGIVEYDVKGSVDSLTLSVEGGLESITVDEKDYQPVGDMVIFHYLKETVTVDDLNVGDEIGLVVDPSNMIVELWILKEGSLPLEEISEDSDVSKNQPNGSGELYFENGVWSN